MRSCPSCQVALDSFEEGSVELDVCPQCSGVWFDDGELRRLSEPDQTPLLKLDARYVAALEKSPADENAPKACPVCKTAMEQFRYLYDSPVLLDSCPTCFGVWVEDGELTAMVAAHDRQAMQALNPAMERTIDHQIAITQLEAQAAETNSRLKLFQRVIGFFSIRRPYQF